MHKKLLGSCGHYLEVGAISWKDKRPVLDIKNVVALFGCCR